MTSITASAAEVAALLDLGLVRQPDRNIGLPHAVERTLEWDTDLTPEETAILTRTRALVRSAIRVTPAEWEALEPVIASLRTNRTRTNAEWSAMTAAQRDSALIDWNRSLTDLLRALLRD